MQNTGNKILVGKIVAPQGIRGEVRVQTYTENPTDFRQLPIINHKLQFVRAIPHSDIIIARLDDVNDRNAAELLRGTELYIERDTLPVLPSGEYYQTDLIGMRVGENTVVAIHNFGAGDILELDNGDMVSFANATVDTDKKEITLKV